ncbi:MAG: hypothetical protein K2N12_00340 [Helicobacter sp.]|nr:hypothetical protein [Helicobacter sp.]
MMKKSLVTFTMFALLGSFAFAADSEVDILAAVSNGAISDKDAIVLNAAQKQEIVGGYRYYLNGTLNDFSWHAIKNFSYYNYLHNQAVKEGRPVTVRPYGNALTRPYGGIYLRR